MNERRVRPRPWKSLGKWKSPLRLKPSQSGDCRIDVYERPPGEYELVNTRCVLLGGQKPAKLKFDVPHQVTRLYRDESLWMTDAPSEQAQMRSGVEGFYGSVLVGGLGLGLVVHYLKPALLSGKVKRVVVVEIDKNVIHLAGGQFDRLSGVEIVNEDIHLYLADLEWGSFDCAFLDTWTGDGVHTFFEDVRPLRRLARRAGVGYVKCWQQDVMEGQLRMALTTRTMIALAQPERLEEWAKDGGLNPYDSWMRPWFVRLREVLKSPRRPKRWNRQALAQRLEGFMESLMG